MHHYPFHPGDYSLATKHWTEDRKEVPCEAGLLRDLAYRRLLDLYYGEEEPIPSKTRLVAIRILMLKHEEIVASVLREKFTLVDGFWRQERADDEVLRYQRRAAASRENGKKGGRPKNPAPTKKYPAGSKQVATRTRTRTRTINTPLPPEGVVLFKEFYAAYPRKVGLPVAARAYGAALGRGATAVAIMGGLVRHIGCDQWQDQTKIPHPATWLNRDGWNDEVAVPPAADGTKPGGWWTSKTGILDKAVELRLPGPPAELDGAGAWLDYVASVWLAAGDGEWINERDELVYRRYVKLRNGGA